MVDHREGGVLVDFGSGGDGREHNLSGYHSVWVEVDLGEGDENRLPVEYIGYKVCHGGGGHGEGRKVDFDGGEVGKSGI